MRGTLIAAALAAALAGCSAYDSVTQRIAQSITPYRITVVQGNFVSQEAASQMQIGMSRDQVKALLGTPLLTDMFHADRWDYVFYFKRGSTSVVQQRDFIVHFAGDRVTSWSGGENLPSNLELLAEIDGDKGRKLAARCRAAVVTGRGDRRRRRPRGAPRRSRPPTSRRSIRTPRPRSRATRTSRPRRPPIARRRDPVADRPHAIPRARTCRKRRVSALGIDEPGQFADPAEASAAADQHSGQQRGRAGQHVAGAGTPRMPVGQTQFYVPSQASRATEAVKNSNRGTGRGVPLSLSWTGRASRRVPFRSTPSHVIT